MTARQSIIAFAGRRIDPPSAAYCHFPPQNDFACKAAAPLLLLPTAAIAARVRRGRRRRPPGTVSSGGTKDPLYAHPPYLGRDLPGEVGSRPAWTVGRCIRCGSASGKGTRHVPHVAAPCMHHVIPARQRVHPRWGIGVCGQCLVGDRCGRLGGPSPRRQRRHHCGLPGLRAVERLYYSGAIDIELMRL